MFTNGYWHVGKVNGVPVKLHWSTALGAAFFSGFQFAPAFWLAFIVLVLVHEFGHAWFVRRLGHRALSVEVMGFGGLCQWDGRRSTRLDRAVIAWGGVVFQALLLVATLAADWLLGPPSVLWQAQVLAAFTTTNLWLIGLNLLPIGPLDGAEAWKVFAAARSARVPLTRVALRLLQGSPAAR